LGIGDWGLGPIPNPQSPIPNPQSPIPILNVQYLINLYMNLNKNLNVEYLNIYFYKKCLIFLCVAKGVIKK